MISGLTFKSLIHFELIFVSGIIRNWFHSFTYGYPVSPALLIEKIILSPLSVLGSIIKDELTVYTWACFCALYSFPLVYVIVFMQVPTVSITIAL